ncbi:single-stranded DNA-binding protein [Enemella evansiae]|uniref:single-stranded DNA-binding protein n=1 Tax=Enemella evansiae TaxID=2016499 RepID=UPI000B97130E|nr:single-stranded DNA-binding protein [Enemella evansiae]OYO13130.1 single-stranded DNA-binding protein [Enemella evansiae]
MHTITFTGHLGRDPELRFNEAGQPWLKLRVAVNRRVKRGEEWVDATPTWWDVTASGDLALNADSSLRHADPVMVVGRVITEEFQDKNGESRTAMKVRADSIGVPLDRRTVTIRKPVERPDQQQTGEEDAPASAGAGAEE